MTRTMMKLSVAVALLSGAAMAQADWTLDGGASSFHYVTSKNAAVSEVNSITGLSGAIGADDKATLQLDLSTVNTAVEIRDERMRDIVFQVADFPSATISVTVDGEGLEQMQTGMPVSGSYTASVDLHGMTQELEAELEIVKLDANTLQVNLARPLIVNAASFGLQDGVEELRNLAALTTINPNVVVDFSLLYRK
ncbi:MAG TPA: YceI family protein [Hyphomicrobiales bacterium]|nr:YceI family protein [Hyphomicrobiales bacterium]